MMLPFRRAIPGFHGVDEAFKRLFQDVPPMVLGTKPSTRPLTFLPCFLLPETCIPQEGLVHSFSGSRRLFDVTIMSFFESDELIVDTASGLGVAMPA